MVRGSWPLDLMWEAGQVERGQSLPLVVTSHLLRVNGLCSHVIHWKQQCLLLPLLVGTGSGSAPECTLPSTCGHRGKMGGADSPSWPALLGWLPSSPKALKALQGQSGPQKGSTLSLRLCYRHLEILIIFEQGTCIFIFHWALQLM